MGASYVVLPMNDELANHMRGMGLSVSSPLSESRMPTLAELKAALDRLDGYRASIAATDRSVDIEVVDQGGYWAGWSTTIWASKAGDRSQPPTDGDTVDVFFHKGSFELASLIVERLAPICGTLVLTDCEASFRVIAGGQP